MTQTKLLDGDPRHPVGFLNYSEAADTPSPLLPLGPTTVGKNDVVYPVTEERKDGKLRVGFSFTAPAVTTIVANYAERLDELPLGERDVVEAAVLRFTGNL